MTAKQDVADHTEGGTTAPGTMRAVVHHVYGPADVLRVAEIPRPAPGDGEVLVQVRAAGLDRGAWHVMTGEPYLGRLAFGLRRPKNPVLGMELAGTVVALGRGVSRFAVGDEVYGVGKGSFAELALAKEGQLARKPGALTFEQAAVVPVSAATALQGLVEVGRVRAGQQVLVTGASGGVGSYAVQIAKALGAEVTGVAGTAKQEFVRELGADHVLDRTRDDFADGSRRYDLVLDVAGRPPLATLRRALTPRGTAVLVGGENGGKLTGGMNRQLRAVILSLFLRQRLAMFVSIVRAPALERLSELVDAGLVTPALTETYPLDRAADAMRDLVAGRVRGKVAIVPGGAER
jgi:NADPH:quinone reductase-like Zn-dependent oxidoreductase